MNYRMRASSDGILPSSILAQSRATTPKCSSHPLGRTNLYGGSSTARDAYDMGSAGVAASAMYSPLSARERPAPSLFDGMQMQAGAGQPQQQPGWYHTSPIQTYGQQQAPAQWNPNSGQWVYPDAVWSQAHGYNSQQSSPLPRNSLTWQEVTATAMHTRTTNKRIASTCMPTIPCNKDKLFHLKAGMVAT